MQQPFVPDASPIHGLEATGNQFFILWLAIVQWIARASPAYCRLAMRIERRFRLEIRPDLTNEQAMQVPKYSERHHDAGDGINWHCLDVNAEQLFGPEPDNAEVASQ